MSDSEDYVSSSSEEEGDILSANITTKRKPITIKKKIRKHSSTDSDTDSVLSSSDDEIYDAVDNGEGMCSKEQKHEESLFEISTTRGKTLKIISEALQNIIGDAIFRINSKGLTLVVDSTHTMAIFLELPANNFDQFYCCDFSEYDTDVEELTVAVSMKKLYTVLKSIGSSTKTLLQILMFTDQPDLIIKFENPDKDQINECGLKILDRNEEEYEPPDFKKYMYEFRLPCEDFKKICQDIKNSGGKTIGFEFVIASKDDFQMICSNDEKESLIGSCRVRRESAGLSLKIHGKRKEKVKNITFSNKYSLERIMNITKCTSLCRDISILFQTTTSEDSEDDGKIAFQYVFALGRIRFEVASQHTFPSSFL